MSLSRTSPWSLLSGRFAFNRHSGEFFLLNPEGALAVEMALRQKSTGEIAAALAKQFGADPQTASRDAEHFIARLKGLDLIPSGDSGVVKA